MARKLTPRPASERAASTAVSGSPNPMSACPVRSSSRSEAPVSGLAPSARTCTTTSAAWNTSARLLTMRTPFSAYSESGNPARRPAPASIRNWVPVLLRTPMAPGTMATRRSPGDISETMPTVIRGMDLLECKHSNRIGGKKNLGFVSDRPYGAGSVLRGGGLESGQVDSRVQIGQREPVAGGLQIEGVLQPVG